MVLGAAESVDVEELKIYFPREADLPSSWFSSLEQFIASHPGLCCIVVHSKQVDIDEFPLYEISNLNQLEYLDLGFPITNSDLLTLFEIILDKRKSPKMRVLKLQGSEEPSKRVCRYGQKLLDKQYRLTTFRCYTSPEIDGMEQRYFNHILHRNRRLFSLAQIQQSVTADVTMNPARGKVVIVGSSGAGKSSLRKRLFGPKYQIEYGKIQGGGIFHHTNRDGWVGQTGIQRHVVEESDTLLPERNVSEADFDPVLNKFIEEGLVDTQVKNQSHFKQDVAENLEANGNERASFEFEEDQTDMPYCALWDFGGDVFEALHRLFLTKGTLYFMVVDLSKFENDKSTVIHRFILCMDTLRLYSPGSPIIVVATFTEHIKYRDTLKEFDTFVTEYQASEGHNLHQPARSFYVMRNRAKALTEDLKTLRNVVTSLADSRHTNSFSNSMHQEFKLSWLRFMDYISAFYGDYVFVEKLKKDPAKYLLDVELDTIFNFFAEAGTILFVTEFENLAVLNPSWLIGTFCRLIFETRANLQDNKNYLRSNADKKQLIKFVETGYVSQSLLPVLLPELGDYIVEFLIDVGVQLLIFADFNRSTSSGRDMLLVPCVLPKVAQLIREETDYHISVEFKQALPIGYFSMLVSYIMQRAAAFESATYNVAIYPTFGRFIIINSWAFDCFQTADNMKIRVWVHDSSQKYNPEIYDIVKSAILRISERIRIEHNFYGKVGENIALLGDVFKAVKHGYPLVAINSNQILATPIFESFYREPAIAKLSFDCFLCHSWGKNNQAHETVKRIYESLTEESIECWFDEMHMTGDVIRSMIDGLGKSENYIIFVTEDFLNRIQSSRGNASRIFHYISSRRDRIILVILDEKLLEADAWSTYFFLTMSGSLFGFVDFTSSAKIQQNKTQLIDHIKSDVHEPISIPGVPKKRLPSQYACFLHHAWGIKNSTHEIVREIDQRLINEGLDCWLDEKKMEDNIFLDTADGLETSRTYTVFITKDWMERVEIYASNISKEFSYISKQEPKSIILIVLEKNVLDARSWSKFVVSSLPPDLPILDMTELKREENFHLLLDIVTGAN